MRVNEWEEKKKEEAMTYSGIEPFTRTRAICFDGNGVGRRRFPAEMAMVVGTTGGTFAHFILLKIASFNVECPSQGAAREE